MTPEVTDYLAAASACYLFMVITTALWNLGHRYAERRRHEERVRAAVRSIRERAAAL